MKKLRLFDSLKFMRAMFVALVAIFILNVAHADTTAIQSVIAYGKTEQSATPTPTNPVPIMTNNGELTVSRNLFDSSLFDTAAAGIVYHSFSIPNGTYTMSTNFPASSGVTNVFIFAGRASSGASSANNGVSANVPRTITVTNGYYTVAYRSGSSAAGNNNEPKNFDWMLSNSSTATAYEPYGGIVANGLTETIRDAAGHKATAQMLLSVGDYKDEQNITTGAITRRVGVKVLDGSENWEVTGTNYPNSFASFTAIQNRNIDIRYAYSTHFVDAKNTSTELSQNGKMFMGVNTQKINFTNTSISTVDEWKQWLAEQYAAGTPVIVVYPLNASAQTTDNVATQSLTTAPVRQTLGAIMNMPIKTILTDNTEIMSGADELIKIATTKYNEESFEDVQDALTGVFNAVDTVVSQTMTQAQAIDQIATNKQTRPDETCPVGKNCLLVEDEQGVPHWYVIAGADEAFSTYTELQYIRLADGAFIITDIYPNQDTEFLVDFQHEQDALKWLFGTRDYPADASNGQNPINKFSLQVFSTSNGGVWMQFDNTTNLEYGTNTVASDATSRLARHQCGIKNQRAWCDGNFISWNSSGGPTNISNFTATNPLVIGAVQTSTGYSSSTFTGKIYSATDLVPCRRDSDSAVGLCRTSTGDFFGNSAGVGTITAGPDA